MSNENANNIKRIPVVMNPTIGLNKNVPIDIEVIPNTIRTSIRLSLIFDRTLSITLTASPLNY